MIFGFPTGADKKVCGFYCVGGANVSEKPTDMVHDFLDVGVSFARSSMFFGGRHLENGEYDGAPVGIVIDSERVEKWVVGCNRDIVPIFSERHRAEIVGEVDINCIPGAWSYWRRDRGVRREWERTACGVGKRVGVVTGHECRLR